MRTFFLKSFFFFFEKDIQIETLKRIGIAHTCTQVPQLLTCYISMITCIILMLLTNFIVYLAFLGSFQFLVVVVGLSQCSVSSQDTLLIRILLL